MTRPTILDLDVVVVPREPTREMWAASGDAVVKLGHVHHDKLSEAVFTSMLSASPYLTAWDDVRKYVEGLEAERKEADHKLVDRYRNPKAGTFSFPGDVAAIVRSLDVAEARIAELEEYLGKCVSNECFLEQDSRRLSEIEKAEARISELEKRLADAEMVIERVPTYLTDMYKAICNGNETAAAGFSEKDELVRAARAYMEVK